MSFLTPENTRFGIFGGVYLSEILLTPIHELSALWDKLKIDTAFQAALAELLKSYAGRPTPLTEISRFSKAINGPLIYLKREDLLHTGAHKINNALGQCLLAKISGKSKVIAETGAGQHGVATASACARLGLECEIYMGAKDIERQAPNVARMKILGAKVHPVDAGSSTLKEAVNAALRAWSEQYETTFYCLGSALGPHPYPDIVASFQSIIGKECRQQINFLPDLILACVGGGSNAIGIFSEFLDEPVRLIGVEGGGKGTQLGEHAARFFKPTQGVLHGCYTYVLQNDEGQIASTHSISAGLDYPAVGPHHAYLFDSKRVEYVSATDEEALEAFYLLSKTEGILPALESSHALAYLIKIGSELPKDFRVIVNLSGRGDKDLQQLT